jgi:predicted ATPase/DNA-binding CsgD family transcriptional regulator
VPSPLLGRAADITALRELLLLPEVRLVTLTGPPGIGKTRLALAVATDLALTLPDGVFFVDLAPLLDISLVPSEIAQTIGIAEHGDRPMLEQVQRALRDEAMLLVLDNFEQILDAAPQLAELLAACPALKLVVTSRAPLRLRWEHEYLVPPLALPGRSSDQALAELLINPAVALFVERARAIQPAFTPDEQRTREIAELCVRLDGLPLAIELAATQIRLFSPAALLARLVQRLPLPGSGPRDLPERQRTLHAAIDWSYNLLDAPARQLFQRLAVFVGGWTLDALDAVCRDADATALPTGAHDPQGDFATLVDHSLVQPESGPGDEPRYRMLESIREYALNWLATSGEEDARRHRHATYFLRLAEELAPGYEGGRRPGGMLDGLVGGLSRLEAEHENLRAALHWIDQRGKPEESLRLAVALGWFWHMHGYLSEGRQSLRRALERPGSEHRTLARANALHRLGALAIVAGDQLAARAPFEESAAICRELQDTRGVARALGGLAYALAANDPSAKKMTAEALELWRRLDSAAGIAEMLLREAEIAMSTGDNAAAERLVKEGFALCRTVDGGVMLGEAELLVGRFALLREDRAQARHHLEKALERFQVLGAFLGAAGCLSLLGNSAAQEGDLVRAATYQEEALALVRYTNDPKRIGPIQRQLGRIARSQRQMSRALELFRESVEYGEAARNPPDTIASLCELGELAILTARPRQAARLFAATAARRETTSLAVPPRVLGGYDQTDVQHHLATLRTQLGADAFAAAWQEGRESPLSEFLTTAWEREEPSLHSPAATSNRRDDPLTPREREVVRLIAEGLTNRQIAERLVIAERTASTHVANILAKLGFATRAQIAAWSAQRSSQPAPPS